MCQILMRNILCIVCCFHQVKGKMVRVSACQDNNTLYLGNICKGWTRDQVRYDTLWLRSWKYRCSFYNLQNLIGQLDSLIPSIGYRLNYIFEIRTFSTFFFLESWFVRILLSKFKFIKLFSFVKGTKIAISV